MTKKHYEAIAHQMLKAYGVSGHDGVLLACDFLANYFEQENSRFNRERFLSACGLEFYCSHRGCNNVVGDSGDECHHCYEAK